jgi:hypothetical protein
MRPQLRKILSFSVLGVFSFFIIVSYISSIFAFDGVEYYPLRIGSVECERVGENVVGVVLVEKPFDYFQVDGGNETDSIFVDTDYNLIVTVIGDDRVPVFFEMFPSSISLGEMHSVEFSFELPAAATSVRFFVSAMVWKEEGIPLSRLTGETIFDA